MTHPFVRRLAIAALALPLLLAGCADDEPVPKTSQSSPPTPSPSETSTEPVEPTLPPEARGKGIKAAEAFVRHYFAAINYAQATGDTTELEKLTLATCRACEGGLDFITNIYARGGTNEGGEYEVRAVKVTGRREVNRHVSIFYLDVKTDHTKQVVSGAADLDRTYAEGSATWRYEVVSGLQGWKIAQWAAQ